MLVAVVLFPIYVKFIGIVQVPFVIKVWDALSKEAFLKVSYSSFTNETTDCKKRQENFSCLIFLRLTATPSIYLYSF
jgi:hypothetical protein